MTLEERYRLAKVIPHRLHVVQRVADTILVYQAAYKIVSKESRVPWWCIGAIHSLECGVNFHCHLHNGDPLTERTKRVPIGRPKAPPSNGKLPYTWVESAVDAISTAWRPAGREWTRGLSLAFLERYNGLGYRDLGVPSPYLWSYTDQYSSGLFVADGKYDPLRCSASVGAAAIFKVLEYRGTLLDALL